MARIGPYEILRRLARGGMAELYLARSATTVDKLVVVKKILPYLAETPAFVRLFVEEARLAALLEHPNIVEVLDLGADDGQHFFVMEHVHGEDARTMLHHAELASLEVPIGLCVHVARSIAAALHYAHERRRPNGAPMGIIHRDVSPSNIMLSFEGDVKLLDFGVAKVGGSIKTRTGILKGKVSYMSPEQARGMPLDRRSDVFALGTVLWEMLTGERLFRTDNDLATLQKIITEPAPSVMTLRPDCPPKLARIVEQALILDRDARTPSAGDMQRELDAIRDYDRAGSPAALATFMHDLFADAEPTHHSLVAPDSVSAFSISAEDMIELGPDDAEDIEFEPTLPRDGDDDEGDTVHDASLERANQAIGEIRAATEADEDDIPTMMRDSVQASPSLRGSSIAAVIPAHEASTAVDVDSPLADLPEPITTLHTRFDPTNAAGTEARPTAIAPTLPPPPMLPSMLPRPRSFARTTLVWAIAIGVAILLGIVFAIAYTGDDVPLR